MGRAEGIHDEDIEGLRQLGREGRIVLLLLGVKAHVLEGKKEAVTTGLFSSVVFFTIAMLINFSLLGNISALAGKEMPAVFIADLLFPHIGGICYSVI